MKIIFADTVAAVLSLMLVLPALAGQQTEPPVQNSTGGDAAAGTTPQTGSSFPDSKVRIVRLSQVKGAVQIDRNTGRGFESAIPNLPVTEGASLRSESGVAEVEFEDNSTLRIAPDTLIEFPRLELRPSGAKASTVNVVKGTLYVSLANTKGNDFTITFGHQRLTPMPSSHLRLQVQPAEARLAVLDGNVQVEDPLGATVAGKKRSLTFDLVNQEQPTLTKHVTTEPTDAWDHDSVEYQKQYANGSAFGNSPYAYGMSDMDYYGSFMDAAGCGSMWRPYFVSMAWDPFANGNWAWYPGAGYSWVSPYPWGWMPYHYGAWNFCPGIGWGWQPGGSWIGLMNAGVLKSKPGGLPQPPRPPGRPPAPGQPSLVKVSLKPLAVSQLKNGNAFVFRNDSAGLGIPRGSFGKLGSFSSGAEQHGSVITPVDFEPLRPGQSAITSSPRPALTGRNESESESRSFPLYSGAAETRGATGSSTPGAAAGAGAGRAPR